MKDRRYRYTELLGDLAQRWLDIVDWVLPRANAVEFAVTQRTELPSFFDAVSQQLINQRESRIRWQQQQWFVTSYVRFALSSEVIALISSVPKLDLWMGDLPEDPTFVLGDTPILWTISHSNLVFALADADDIEWFRSIGLELTATDL